VWHLLLSRLGLQTLVPAGDQDLADWWLTQRRRVDATSRPVFDSIVLLVAWCVWKERNARVFGKASSTAATVVIAIIEEGEQWATAGYAPLAALDLLWSQNNLAM
jgi:hypothetical protein